MKKKPVFTLLSVCCLLMQSCLTFAGDGTMNVPYYVQGKDASWADEKLGNKSEFTIRTHGCALTSIAMIASYHTKKNYNPSKMNDWLKANNGFDDAWEGGKYVGEVQLRWPAMTAFDDGWVYTRFDWSALPADLVLIEYYLDKRIPVIAEVLYKGAPHYVVLTGYGENGFEMNDPEFPDEHIFNNQYNISDKWGSGPARNIYGIRILYPGDLNGKG